jgi:hypothetical protein
MEVSELLAAIQTHLNDQFPNIPIAVAGGEGRPIPAIEIDDIQLSELSQASSMSGYSSSTYDQNGVEQERKNTTPYSARVNFIITHRGSIEASQLNDRLRAEFEKLKAHPERLSEAISRVEPGSLTGMNHQFVNPTETSFTQSVRFTSALVYSDTSYRNIEDIIIDIENTNFKQ